MPLLLLLLVLQLPRGVQAQTGCPAPMFTFVQDVQGTRAFVVWVGMLPPNTVEYEVWISEDDGPFELKLTTKEFSALLSALEPSTRYRYKVRTKCAPFIFSEFTEEAEFVTLESDPPGCGPPMFINVMDLRSTSAQIMWNLGLNANSYEIQISTDRRNWETVDDTENLSYVIEDLQPGRTYFVRIRSRCSDNEQSSFSEIFEFTTPETDPPTECQEPDALELFNVSSNSASIEVIFDDPSQVPPSQGLLVIYYPVDRPNERDTLLLGAFEGVFLSGLTPNTRYKVEIRGLCFGPNGPEVTDGESIEFKTLDASTLCEAPFFVEQIEATSTSVTITWPPMPGAIGYQVAWSPDGGQTWIELDLTEEPQQLIEGLEPERFYLVKVRSLCEDEKFSDYSFDFDVVTETDNGCANPEDLDVVDVSDTSARICWRASQSTLRIIRYRVVWSDGQGFFEETTRETCITLSNLKPGTFYTLGVSSICIDEFGNEIFSPERRIDFKTTGVAPCEAPAEIGFEFVGQTNAGIFWSFMPNAVSYRVHVVSADGTYDETFDTPESFIQLEGLSPLTVYFVTVQTICDEDRVSEPSEPSGFETEPAFRCRDVRALRAEDIGPNSARIVWAAAAGATEYEVWILDMEGNPIQNATVTEPRFEVTGLAPETQYVAFVRSRCNGPDGQPGAGQYQQRVFTTAKDTTSSDCFAPKELRAIVQENGSVVLEWERVEGAEAYLVEFSQDGGRTWERGPVMPDNRMETQDPLPPNRTFLFRVRSICGDRESEPSNVVEARNSQCPPPFNVRVEGNAPEVTVRWNAPTPPAVQYEVFLSMDCDSFINVGFSRNLQLRLTNLLPGQEYCVFVRSVCEGQVRSNPSDIIRFGGGPKPCPAPRNLRNQETTQTTTQLTWDQVAGANAYQVFYSEDGENFLSVFSQTNRIGIENLKPGTCYVWRVVAMCGDGAMSEPATGEFCTQQAPGCPRPTNVQVEVISTDSAYVVWTPVSGARDYIIELSTDNQNFTPVATSETSEIRLGNLQPNTRYFVRVIARCGQNTLSPPTEPREFRTQSPCLAPEGLTLAEFTPNQAVVRWTPVPGAVQYEVWLQTSATGPFQLYRTVATAQVSISPLNVGSVYRVYIVTICDNQRKSGESTRLEFETPRPDCPTPSGLTVTEVGENTARASWNAVPGATAYRVSLSNNGGQTYDVMFVSQTNLNVLIQQLTPGTNYLIRVQSICGDGAVSSNTQPVGFRTLIGFACNPPSSVTVSQVSPTSAFILWTRVNEAVQYVVTYTSASGSITLPPQAATSIFLNNLTARTAYTVTVRSICGEDTVSDPSAPREFTTPELPSCLTPREVRVVEVGMNSAIAQWASVSGALSYQVILYDAAGNVIREVVTATTQLELGSLQTGTAYSVAVRSICANQVRSEPSERVPFETLAPAECVRPEGLEVVTRNENSAAIEWQPVPGAVAYEVSVSKDGGNTFQSTITQTTDHVLTDMPQDVVWIVRVRTICSNERTSPYTPPIEVRPSQPTDCPTPTGLTVGDLTSTTAYVFWSPMMGVAGYEVSYETPNGWVKLNITQRTNQLITGLLPNTSYRVRVRSVCSNGTFSNPTEPVAFTTRPQPACAAPASITATRIESTVLRLSWPRATSALGYEVAYSSDGGQTFTTRFTQDTSIVLSSLRPGTNYVIRIRTLCQGNIYSEPVFNEFRTPSPGECPEPQNLRVDGKGVEFLVIRWDAAPGAIRYQLEYRLVGAPNFTTLPPTVNLVHEITGLGPEDSVEVRVRSICSLEPMSASPYTDVIIGVTNPLPQNCPVVAEAQFPNVRSDRAVMEWAHPVGPPQPLHYEVMFSRDGGQTFETLIVQTPRIEFTNLNPQTTYFVKIRSVCEGGVRSDESTTFNFTTTGADACPVPVTTVSSVTANEAVVSWSRVFGAVIYEVSVSRKANGPFEVYQYTQDTSSRLFNLQAGDTLYVRVRTACSLSPSVFSNYSAVQRIIVPQPECSAPREVAVSQISGSSAVVEWAASTSSPVSGYRVLVSADNGLTWDTLLTQTTRIELRELRNSTLYLVRVSTLCGADRLSDDKGIEFRTLAPQGCTTPQNLSVTNVQEKSADVSWNSVPGALGYQIAYKETDSQFFTTITITATQYQLTGLTPSRRYIVQVRAICDTSESPYTPWTDLRYFETKAQTLVCPAPTSIEIAPGSTTAVVRWPAIPNATAYQVAYGEASSFNLLNLTVTTNQATLTGLKPNTTYKVRVRVTCGIDRSVFTPTVQFTTTASREIESAESVFNVQLYPNPARGQVQLRFSAAAEGFARVVLTDLSGRTARTFELNASQGDNEWPLNLDGLTAGMYLVQIDHQGDRVQSKLWVQP